MLPERGKEAKQTQSCSCSSSLPSKKRDSGKTLGKSSGLSGLLRNFVFKEVKFYLGMSNFGLGGGTKLGFTFLGACLTGFNLFLASEAASTIIIY